VRWLPILCLLALPAAASPTKAAKVARATVEPRLRVYKPDPASWKALGPGTDEALIEVAGDAKAELLLRARAVSTLAWFPTTSARKFVEATIDKKATSDDPGDRLLVRKAAVTLGWLGGTAVPERLAPLLQAADPEVRLDAAVGLGLTRLAASAEALKKRLDVEPVESVRAQISRQIQVIEAVHAPAAARTK
jgi:hypothetical protein